MRRARALFVPRGLPGLPQSRLPAANTAPQLRLSLSLCALGLAAALLPAVSRAENPQESGANMRLEALRNALVDKALKAPTRVRSAAWVDESGTLRENVQINSDIKLRGIRVLSYLEEAGALKADLVADAAASIASKGACAAPGTRFKHHAALVQSHAPSDGQLGYYFVPELAERAEKTLLALFTHDEGWVVTPTVAARTAYERVLLGPDTPAASPYVMRLSLEAAKAAPPPPPEPPSWMAKLRGLNAALHRLGTEQPIRMPAKPLLLALRVEERSSGRVVWQEQAVLEYPESEVSALRQPLPPSLARSIESTLLGWRLALNAALGCEPLHFPVATAESGQITIHAGSRIGVRVGDQLLLVDRTRVPGNMLEAGALDRAALIEVQSIAADRALARRLAGPAPAEHARDLVAMPL